MAVDALAPTLWCVVGKSFEQPQPTKLLNSHQAVAVWCAVHSTEQAITCSASMQVVDGSDIQPSMVILCITLAASCTVIGSL
jgi:hypothetical protein